MNQTSVIHNLLKLTYELQVKVDDLEKVVQTLFRALLSRDLTLARDLGNAKFDIDHEEPPSERERSDQWACYVQDAIKTLEQGRETPLS
jgi:hypothetical protein